MYCYTNLKYCSLWSVFLGFFPPIFSIVCLAQFRFVSPELTGNVSRIISVVFVVTCILIYIDLFIVVSDRGN